MQAAYTAASAGDTINLAAGVYPGQVLSGGSKAVTFRGRPSAPAGYAVLRQLQTANDNLTLDGLDIDANKQMLSNGHALFENGGGNNDTIENSRIGNVTDQKGALVDGDHLTFDNVTFHDVYQVTDGVHNECIYAIGVPNFVARDNTFTNCATMDLFFKYGSWWSPQPPAYGNVTLENNVFGHSTNGTGWHYYGLYIGDTGPNSSTLMDHWTVRNNTFENDVMLGSNANTTRWDGNLGNWECITGITYNHNLGAKCGTTDQAVNPASSCGPPACPTLRTAAFGWTDPAHGDFHLTPTSTAINNADPTDYPARDHDGIARPSGAAPDAGAYEYH